MSIFTAFNRAKFKDHLGFIHEANPFRIYLLAFIVGTISTFATIGFIKFYQLLIRFFYFSPTTDFKEIATFTPIWYFFIFLMGGGLLIGLFIYFFIPAHGHGHGTPHALYAYRHYSYISPQDGLSSTLATSLSLGVGASVGREFPAAFFSSTLTSILCQIFRLKGHTFRVLLACAIAASLATSLHSSFVGIFFVIEIVSFSLTALDLLPIALAVFISVFIRDYVHHLLAPDVFNMTLPYPGIQILPLIILGLLCGILAFLYIKSLSITAQSSFQSRIPKWLWPMLGGLGLSLIAIQYPEALGLGFLDMALMIEEMPNFAYLLFLCLAKFLAVIFSLGFGFSGGIFTPTVFLGIAFGALFSSVLMHIQPHDAIGHGMYAFAGAAAFAAVVLGAPLTMTVLIFEITRDIHFTLNIFIVVFVAMLFMRATRLKSFFETQYTFLFDR